MAGQSQIARMKALVQQRESLIRQIESSAAAHRKCKSMRGIEGVKRAAYFLKQKERAELQLAEIDREIQLLQVDKT